MFSKYLIIITIIFLVQAGKFSFNTTSNGFPKVIWSYWQQGYDQAPFFTKLCLQNKDKYAKAEGWSHVFLSKDNLHEYIDPQKVEMYFNMFYTHHIQLKADLIRLLLILKYGGLWLDANSYLLTDLSWVDNPNQTYIHNKISPSPDIILAANSEGLNSGKSIFKIDKTGEIINILPIYENWMIFAKPNNEFLSDCLNIYVEVCKKSKQKMDQELIQSGIILPQRITNAYFIGSDYLEQIAIQRKQKELQHKNLAQLAVEYYHLQHIEAHEGPFKIFLEYNEFVLTMWSDESIYSTQEIQKETQPSFFRKFLGWHHRFFSNYLRNYANYNCWGLQMFVEEGSQVSDSLLKQVKGTPLMGQIEEIHKNLANKSYCQSFVDNKDKLNLEALIISVYWIIILLTVLAAYYCYKCANETEENKYQALQ